MKLEPRKATDRGGWLCMPLVINGPEGKPGWKKVRCPECGTLCWQRPEDAGVVKASHLDSAVCTKCALRKAVLAALPCVGRSLHVGQERDFGNPHGVDNDMHMNVSAAVMPVRVGAYNGLVSGEMFPAKFLA